MNVGGTVVNIFEGVALALHVAHASLIKHTVTCLINSQTDEDLNKMENSLITDLFESNESYGCFNYTKCPLVEYSYVSSCHCMVIF